MTQLKQIESVHDLRQSKVDRLRRLAQAARAELEAAEHRQVEALATRDRVLAETAATFDDLFRAATHLTDLQTRLSAVHQTLKVNKTRASAARDAVHEAEARLADARAACLSVGQELARGQAQLDKIADCLAATRAVLSEKAEEQEDEDALEQFLPLSRGPNAWA